MWSDLRPLAGAQGSNTMSGPAPQARQGNCPVSVSAKPIRSGMTARS
jgi:hypothetical protein